MDWYIWRRTFKKWNIIKQRLDYLIFFICKNGGIFMLFIILGAIGLFLLLFIWSACVVSSECSRLEEMYDDQDIGNV